jgi:hypothetical protein
MAVMVGMVEATGMAMAFLGTVTAIISSVTTAAGMEPPRPGQCLPLLLIRDDEKKLARAERRGRVFFDAMMIAVNVWLGAARCTPIGLCRTAPIVCAASAPPEHICPGFAFDARRTELAKKLRAPATAS